MTKCVAVVPYSAEGWIPLNKENCPLFEKYGEISCVGGSGDNSCSGYCGHVSKDVIECQEQ